MKTRKNDSNKDQDAIRFDAIKECLTSLSTFAIRLKSNCIVLERGKERVFVL